MGAKLNDAQTQDDSVPLVLYEGHGQARRRGLGIALRQRQDTPQYMSRKKLQLRTRRMKDSGSEIDLREMDVGQ